MVELLEEDEDQKGDDDGEEAAAAAAAPGRHGGTKGKYACMRCNGVGKDE